MDYGYLGTGAECHVAAFAFYNGGPAHIVLDNLRVPNTQAFPLRYTTFAGPGEDNHNNDGTGPGTM